MLWVSRTFLTTGGFQPLTNFSPIPPMPSPCQPQFFSLFLWVWSLWNISSDEQHDQGCGLEKVAREKSYPHVTAWILLNISRGPEPADQRHTHRLVLPAGFIFRWEWMFFLSSYGLSQHVSFCLKNKGMAVFKGTTQRPLPFQFLSWLVETVPSHCRFLP